MDETLLMHGSTTALAATRETAAQWIGLISQQLPLGLICQQLPLGLISQQLGKLVQFFQKLRGRQAMLGRSAAGKQRGPGGNERRRLDGARAHLPLKMGRAAA